MSPAFEEQIDRMNEMYRLPKHKLDRLDHDQGWVQCQAVFLKNFKDILAEELDEIDDIQYECSEPSLKTEPITVLVNLADLLGDIVVYCFSEARKYDIPLEQVLQIIMESNFSKLPDDGIPIYDARGKFLKDPKNYWRPEGRIRELLIKHYFSHGCRREL